MRRLFSQQDPFADRSFSWEAARRTAMLPVVCLLAAVLAMLLAQSRPGSRVDVMATDWLQSARSVKPGPQTVLVVVDSATVAQTGKYPYDREMVAHALDILGAAGARRIYLDSALNTSEDAAGDEALIAALRRLGSARVALPVFRSGTGEVGTVVQTPPRRFAQHATLVATEITPQPDRRVRLVSGLSREGYPLASDWLLNGQSAADRKPLRLEASISAGDLVRVSLLDLVEGRAGLDLFSAKDILIGHALDVPQTRVTLGSGQSVARIEMIGLGTETLRAGLDAAEAGGFGTFLIVLAMTILAGFIMTQFGLLPSLVVVSMLGIAWPVIAQTVQSRLHVTMPTVAPFLAAALVLTFLRIRSSAVMQRLAGQWDAARDAGQKALAAAVEVLDGPAVAFDAGGRTIAINAAFRALFGSNLPPKFKGTAHLRMFFGEQAIALVAIPDFEAPGEATLSVAGTDGETRYHRASIRWVRTVQGPLAIAGFKDVTEARRLEIEREKRAFSDPVTGLANSTAFHARLQSIGADEQRPPFGLVLVDIDCDVLRDPALGANVADRLRQDFAERLARLVRKEDLAARLSGDVFAVVVPSEHEADSTGLAQRILASLATPFDAGERTMQIRASVGVAFGPIHGSPPETVLKLADAAMYQAKGAMSALAVHSPAGTRVYRAA